MRNYWLDSDVLIRAKDDYYPFEVVSAFWDVLDEEAANGRIGSSIVVHDELVRGNDELADWARERTESFFVMPDSNVQSHFSTVSDWVRGNYEQAFAADFLSGADPWIIAHAMAEGGAVVTQEVLVSAACKRVKIPNVCREFQVRCVNTRTMLVELRARFVRER